MPQSAREYARAIRTSVWSIWHGLSVTLSYLLRRPITVQYPDRTPLPVREMLPPRYRGFLEVDVSICTGCQACERACPINCISMELEKDPRNPKQRLVTQFDIDEAKCMFCGLCVEPCPTGSIQHTQEFEASTRHIRNLVFRWAAEPWPVYKVAKDATYYPRAPLGSILRPLLEARAWDAPAPEYLPPEPPAPPAPAKPVVKAAPAPTPPSASAPPATAPAAAAASESASAGAPASASASASAPARPPTKPGT